VRRMSRTERVRHMHERRVRWQPIPRCAPCGRALSVLTLDGVSPYERSTVDGVLSADSPVTVTAAFHTAARGIEQRVEQIRPEPSIWDLRLRDYDISALVVAASARGQRGWSVLRLTPSFGARVELFALARSAIGSGVRVVLAGVAPSTGVYDVRIGRTLILDVASRVDRLLRRMK
jgi:hypothetical protein